MALQYITKDILTRTAGEALLDLPYDTAFIAGYDSAMVAADVVAQQRYGKMGMVRSGEFIGEGGYIETQATGSALICDIEKNGTSIYAIKPQFGIGSTITIPVTVAMMKYVMNGGSQATLNLIEGNTYIFNVADSTNVGHVLVFSTIANGTHGGGTEHTTGITRSGTPGQAGATVTYVVPVSAPDLFYYCQIHGMNGGMGGIANTPTAGGYNLNAGSLSTTTFVAGDRISFKVTQIGSTVAGKGVCFTLKCRV